MVVDRDQLVVLDPVHDLSLVRYNLDLVLDPGPDLDPNLGRNQDQFHDREVDQNPDPVSNPDHIPDLGLDQHRLAQLNVSAL